MTCCGRFSSHNSRHAGSAAVLTCQHPRNEDPRPSRTGGVSGEARAPKLYHSADMMRNVNVSCHHCSTQRMSTKQECHCFSTVASGLIEMIAEHFCCMAECHPPPADFGFLGGMYFYVKIYYFLLHA